MSEADRFKPTANFQLRILASGNHGTARKNHIQCDYQIKNLIMRHKLNVKEKAAAQHEVGRRHYSVADSRRAVLDL